MTEEPHLVDDDVKDAAVAGPDGEHGLYIN